MKISFIVPKLNLSGGLRVVSIYARLLSKRGHTVTVVSAQAQAPSLRQRVKHLLRWKGYQFKDCVDDTFFRNVNFDVIVTQSNHISEKDVPDSDVIIATWWETAEWIAPFSRDKGEKFYFVQGYEINNLALPTEKVKATYLLPYQQITISNWLVNILKDIYKSKQVCLVPNGVDLKSFNAVKRTKQERPTIGFLFSETGSKGIDITLAVIEMLKSKIPSLRVVCFGANSPVNIELPTYFELTVKPIQNDIPLIYSRCDVWLFCSRYEGFGLPVLEAMACRTPVVSTRCGGPEGIINDQVNGYLCEIDDIPSLVNTSLNLLLSDESEWEAISQKAYDYAAECSWDAAVIKLESSLLNQ